MRRLGSPSWSLSVSDEPALDLALYVRDALRLDTSTDPLAPPPLINRPPDRSNLLDSTDFDVDGVVEEWAAWWRTALAFEARWRRRTPGGDFESWVRERAEDRAPTVGEPPDFAALSGSPALRQTVVALHEESKRWSASSDRVEVEGRAPYDLVRSTAEETISRHGVPPDQVNGIVFVVNVDGAWWRLAEPGVVVSSASDVRDHVTAESLLREVFESGLDAERD